MLLSDEAITEYQKLFRKRFNRKISRAEAIEGGKKLIHLVKLIYKSKYGAQNDNRK